MRMKITFKKIEIPKSHFFIRKVFSNAPQRLGYDSVASKIPMEFSEVGIQPSKNTQTFS